MINGQAYGIGEAKGKRPSKKPRRFPGARVPGDLFLFEEETLRDEQQSILDQLRAHPPFGRRAFRGINGL